MDATNNAVRRIDLATNIVTTLAGSPFQAPGNADGFSVLASFSNPAGISVNSAGTIAIIVSGA